MHQNQHWSPFFAITTPLMLVLASTFYIALPVAQASSDIIVTNDTDQVNGITSTVAALLANPGPDGISLREAILAANNNPGTYSIRFASSLKNATILVNTQLPPLTGGGVTVEGDIDGDGKPDVTLGRSANFVWDGNCDSSDGCAFVIASSQNQLHAITLEGFGVGVEIGPIPSPKGVMATHQTLSNNSVSALVMRKITDFGVIVTSQYTRGCGLWGGSSLPCWTYNTWTNTTITGNTIQSGQTGIKVSAANAGERFENSTITDNTILISGPDTAISLDIGSNATETSISGTLIARNSISGSVDTGIDLTAGSGRGTLNILDNVQVLDNNLNFTNVDPKVLCCHGINVQAGNDGLSAMSPDILPFTYSDGNETKNILLRGNTIGGTLVWGVMILAGDGFGNSSNNVHDVQIQANIIRSTTPANAIFIWTDGGRALAPGTTVSGNQVSRIAVEANRITVGKAIDTQHTSEGAVVIAGGGGTGQQGSVNDIQLINNVIGPGSNMVHLFGGMKGSTGNTLAGVRLVNNTLAADPGGAALEVTANEDTIGNTISDVSVLNSILLGSLLGEIEAPMINSSIVTEPKFAKINGDIQADPKFVAPLNGDFHLQANSPAIDAASSIGAPTLDFDGLKRVTGQIDIGAYQFAGSPRPSPTTAKPLPTSKIIKTPGKSTIVCSKGKVIKKVTTVNPKCPAGYKKK